MKGVERACQKKLTQESPGLWRCQMGHSCQQPSWRYLCRCEVSDHTDTVQVQLYDSVAQKLFGEDASKCAQAWEDDAAETMLQRALFRPLLLRVQSKKEVWQEEERIKRSVEDISDRSLERDARKMLSEVKETLGM